MTPPTPHDLHPDELERSLRRNALAGFFGMLWMTAALGMPLALFMRAIGASGFQLGLLAGTWQIAMLAQIASALVVERLARRKPYWAVISLMHRALWIVPALLPALLPDRRDLWPAIIIVALSIANLLGQAGTAPWQSWMADLLPHARAGRFWGERHRVLSLGLLLAGSLYGLILNRESSAAHPYLGFQIVFTIATVCGLADIFIHFTVHEPEPHPVHPESTLLQRLAAPLRQPGYLRFTVAMGVWVGAQAMLGYNIGLPGFFSMVYLKESFQVSYAQASCVFLGAALGAALWTPAIGRLLDRWGGRRVLLTILLAGPFTMLAWLPLTHGTVRLPFLAQAVPQPVILLTLASVLIGGLYSGSWMCQVRLTQVLTIPAGRTISMGLHWTIVGLLAAAGPLTAGWIKDHVHFAGFSYFQMLVVLHLVLSWGVAWPLVRGLRE